MSLSFAPWRVDALCVIMTCTADFVYIHAAVGAYVFAGSASVATGGKPFPLGRPVIT